MVTLEHTTDDISQESGRSA